MKEQQNSASSNQQPISPSLTEREKRDQGLWYRPADKELVRLNQRARCLCQQYNALPLQEDAPRDALRRKLLGKVGKEVQILPQFWCDYGHNIFLGDYFFSNYQLVILDCAPVTFGDHVLVGPNCGFYTAIHPFDQTRRDTGLERAEPIQVGNHVWFGGGVTVLPGAVIGDGCVIGAGSVVKGEIPPGMIAAGNPCRPIRPVPQGDGSDPFGRQYQSP